jgi:hypothetical protein
VGNEFHVSVLTGGGDERRSRSPFSSDRESSDRSESFSPFASPLSPLPSPSGLLLPTTERRGNSQEVLVVTFLRAVRLKTPLHLGKGDGDLPPMTKVILS